MLITPLPTKYCLLHHLWCVVSMSLTGRCICHLWRTISRSLTEHCLYITYEALFLHHLWSAASMSLMECCLYIIYGVLPLYQLWSAVSRSLTQCCLYIIYGMLSLHYLENADNFITNKMLSIYGMPSTTSYTEFYFTYGMLSSDERILLRKRSVTSCKRLMVSSIWFLTSSCCRACSVETSYGRPLKSGRLSTCDHRKS